DGWNGRQRAGRRARAEIPDIDARLRAGRFGGHARRSARREGGEPVVIKADQVSEWWDRRKPREQLLVIAVAALTLLFAADALLLRPLRIQIADSSKRLAGTRSELATLQQQVEERDRAGSEQLRAPEA